MLLKNIQVGPVECPEFSMIESNNPEIDVNELMDRINAEVARRRDLGLSPRNGSDDASSAALPEVPFLVPLPTMAAPRRVDVKEERLTGILQRAREKTEVSRRIPKLLRRFFRKQGGYNKLLLESVAVLAKTNVELNKRLQELGDGVERQNRWLSDLRNTRAADAAWMKAAATIIASTRRQCESLWALRSEFDRACEHLRNLQAQADGMREQERNLQAQADRMREQERNLQAQADRMREQEIERVVAASNAVADQMNVLEHRNLAAGEEFRTLRSEFDRACDHLRNLQAQADGMGEVLDSSLARQTEQLDMQIKLGLQINDLHTAAENARTLRSELDRACEHLRNLQAQTDGMRDVFDGRLARKRGGFISAKADSHQLDTFYLGFENRFRGARDVIKERLRFYLPILRKARAGRRARPVLDVGCGRGEWLELLREEKLDASGVDLNEAMVAECKKYRLNALQADAIEFLGSLPDRSQGAITGFHIIEHLPLKMLIELIVHSRRVLKPGGIAIFESPNCMNLMVGACYFNCDPTHRNPVFPETAQFMLETYGFERVRLEFLSPMDTTQLGNIDEEPRHIRELLYGPQDFAVIGYAPAAE
jgi:O-antigen chain-terminating methyltransferase